MKITTEYSKSDLHKGKCKSCKEKTLVTDNGKCPGCIEADKFYEITMKRME